MRGLSVAALAAALLLLTGAAAGQPVCLARDALVQQLDSEFGERLLWQGHGQAEPGRPPPLLEIFASRDGASWTLVQSLPPSAQNPGGLSCFLAAGPRWTPAPLPSDGRKS